MSDDVALSVAELVEYCQTQAALLAGRTETIGAEADELLEEITDDIEQLRSRLSESADGGNPDAAELDRLDELERELEEKQAVAEAKQARMTAFQDLSDAYVDLAAEVEGADDWRASLDRVVQFEHEHDAPAYFEDRLTILEAVQSEE